MLFSRACNGVTPFKKVRFRDPELVNVNTRRHMERL
ncbi:hypothetical protein JOE57_002745 [Microlunatus panaciterrae]|uniref:Uncharacterized protein n=1 Tax=Microlunatus panaciterrae TaxID=400768 RepID=A0ABS2RLD2_9ACTN|nr:hypothetical protein [Microlunatus panaciterrae]